MEPGSSGSVELPEPEMASLREIARVGGSGGWEGGWQIAKVGVRVAVAVVNGRSSVVEMLVLRWVAGR
jgi:hypothetical protein